VKKVVIISLIAIIVVAELEAFEAPVSPSKPLLLTPEKREGKRVRIEKGYTTTERETELESRGERIPFILRQQNFFNRPVLLTFSQNARLKQMILPGAQSGRAAFLHEKILLENASEEVTIAVNNKVYIVHYKRNVEEEAYGSMKEGYELLDFETRKSQLWSWNPGIRTVGIVINAQGEIEFENLVKNIS